MPKLVHQDPTEIWSFDQFRLSPKERWIERSGQPLDFGSRTFEILLMLMSRAGEVVSKRELLNQVWPDTFVEEVSLRVQIAALRKALHDGKNGNRFIANIPGKGYSFVPAISKSTATKLQKAETDRLSRSNLPTLPYRMIGREVELSNILGQLIQHRFVTIVGPGGIGKTTLAISVARAIAAEHGLDIRFVSFSALNDPDLVVSTIASSFGVRSAGDGPTQPLLNFLRAKHLLVVLDCCEHLVEQAAAIAERLILETDGVSVLATSREPLSAAGEHVHRLFPLDIPPAESAISAARARSFPGVELFVERAKANSDQFVFDDSIAPTVVQICRRLDGIPLAIELAAARTSVFGVVAVSRGLTDVLTLLRSGRRTALPRHQTLRATLDWSYLLLSPSEQLAMRRLSVFRGPFTLESAVAVLTCEQQPASEARESVGKLVSKSLLTANHGREPMLYQFLDTTRAYAAEALAQSGELQEIKRRHAIYCLTLLRNAEADWESAARDQWVEKYSVVIDDVRAVQDWAFSSDGDPLLGIEATVNSAPLLFALLLMDEYCERAEQALKFVHQLKLEDSAAEMKLRLSLGVAIFNARGTSPTMIAAAARALEIAEKNGATTFQLRALWQLARERSTSADYRGALDYCEKFDAVAQQTQDEGALVARDRMIALGLFFVGRLRDARTFGERAVEHPAAFSRSLHMSFNEYDHRVASRSHLARILWPLGYQSQAAAVAAKGLEYGMALGYAPTTCYILTFAVIPIAFWSHDLPAARKHIALLREHSAELPHGYWHVWSQLYEGIADIEEHPLASCRNTASILSRVCEPFIADVLSTFRTDFVGDIVTRRLARDESGWSGPEVLRGLACYAAKAGDLEKSASLLNRATDVARQQGALSWELRAALSLVDLWAGRPKQREALGVLRSVYERFSDPVGGADLEKAKRLLTDLAGLPQAETIRSSGN